MSSRLTTALALAGLLLLAVQPDHCAAGKRARAGLGGAAAAAAPATLVLRSDLRRCRCIYCTQLASTCLRTAPCLFFTTLRLRGTPHIRSGSRPAKQHGGSSAACMLPVRPQPCWQSDRHRASPRPLSIHLMQVPAAAACCKTRRTRSTPHPCPFRRPPSRCRLLRGWVCGGGG